MPLPTKHALLIALAFTAVPLVRADSIAITYSLAGTATVVGATDTTLTLDAQASGLILSSDSGLNAAWNPITYSDQSVLDFTTNLLNGNFTIVFQDGDTLTGTIFEDDTAIDTSPTQTGSFPQTLTFTGGTGEFAGATGSVTGLGYLGTTSFAVSGSGVVNAPAVPEPSSAALLVGGLALLAVSRWRRTAKNGFPSIFG
jgi:PEP-CTERM motif